MSAMTGLRAVQRRQCGLPTRRIQGEHPREHLRSFAAFCRPMHMPGFNSSMREVSIQEAACWAHVRRKFYDL